MTRRGRGGAMVRFLGSVMVLAACGEETGTGPEGNPPVDESELIFLRLAAGAPPLITTDTSVVATFGEALRVELFYAGGGGGDDRGERFLRFELDDRSLFRYPPDHPRQGAEFQPGDTVTIRIIVPADTLLARFEPTGLGFDPELPAELELSYVEADDDFDDDGDSDPELEGEIDLYRQERIGEPWFRIGEIKDLELDKIQAELTSFTRYALAI